MAQELEDRRWHVSDPRRVKCTTAGFVLPAVLISPFVGAVLVNENLTSFAVLIWIGVIAIAYFIAVCAFSYTLYEQTKWFKKKELR